MGSRIPIILDARSLFEAPVWRRRSIEDDRRAAAVLDTAIEAGISVVFVDPESHAARRWLARHEVSVVALTGARALAIDGREARLVDVDLLRQGDYRAEIEHAASAGLDVVAAEPSLSFRPRGAAPPTKLSPAIVREIEEDDARWRIVDAVRAIAAAHHTSPACVAIAWTLAVRGVGSVIVRASETDTRPWWLDAVALLSPASMPSSRSFTMTGAWGERREFCAHLEPGDALTMTRQKTIRSHHAWAYSGRVRVDGGTQTWSGEGTVGTEEGRFDVRTEDEVYRASVCELEAQSGRTIATFRRSERPVDPRSTRTRAAPRMAHETWCVRATGRAPNRFVRN